MRYKGFFSRGSTRNTLDRLSLRAALVATIGLTSACSNNANLSFIDAQPKTPAQRNHTTFYPALVCMDNLFVQAKRRPITISANQIPDKTNSVSVDARGMIVTALNHMTRKSNAFIFVEQGLVGRTAGDTLDLEKDDEKRRTPPSPVLYVNGSISQVDRNPRSTNVGVVSTPSSGSSGGLTSTTATPNSSNSIVTLDLHLVRFPSRIVIPGSAISNSMTVSARRWGAGLGGEISQRTLGLTLQVDRLESSGQAVRNLIELGLIEMLGNYTGVPFWECLRLPQTNAKKTAKEEKTHLKQTHSPEQLRRAQDTLNTLGYLEVQPTGLIDDATRKALAHFQARQGLLANGTLDFDTARALENTRPKVTPKPVKRHPKQQPKRRPKPAKQSDDGYQSIQVFVDSAF